MVREREVEKYLCKEMNNIGYECIKFVPEQCSGMPDRMVLLDDGRVLWVELKTDGGRLSAIQKYRHAQLAKLGHAVIVVWNKEQVDDLVKEMQRARERIKRLFFAEESY